MIPLFRALLAAVATLTAVTGSIMAQDKFDPSKELSEKFRLAFNAAGQLKQVDEDGKITERPFEFDVFKGDQAKNQQRYENIGTLVNEIVFQLLEDRGGLRRVPLKVGAEFGNSFFFATPDWEESKKLMILIHGSGVVRAGQWARRLIMNEDLDKGTQLPYISRAQSLGFAVVSLNTNDGKGGNWGAFAHAESFWREFMQSSRATSIAIVAHSFGGAVVVLLASKFERDFSERVFSVSLTDSVHSDVDVPESLKNIAVNYASSEKPLGQGLDGGAIPRVSAGHRLHEWSSYSAMEAIFQRLKSQLKEKEEL